MNNALNKNALTLGNIIEEKHEKKWVALSRDKTEVIDFDESLVQLKNKIGDAKVVFMKVPPADVYLSLGAVHKLQPRYLGLRPLVPCHGIGRLFMDKAL